MVDKQILIPLLYAFYCFMVSCESNVQSPPPSNMSSGENYLAFDSSGWYSIDSLPLQIKKIFKNPSKAISGYVILDTIRVLSRKVIIKSLMQIEEHQFEYTATYTRSENYDLPSGYSGKLIAATVRFDNYLEPLSKCNLLNFGNNISCAESGIVLSISNTKKTKEIQNIKLGKDEYFIFNVAPFGWGLCPEDVTIVIKYTDTKIDFFIINDIYSGDLIDYSDWLWGDINNDNWPDFYQLSNISNDDRNGQYIYIPTSLFDGGLLQLNGLPMYKFDFIRKKYSEIK